MRSARGDRTRIAVAAARDRADALAAALAGVALAGVDPRPRARAGALVGYLETRGALLLGNGRKRRAAVRVAPAAGRLVAAAARMLPAGDRARYAEEFRAELWQIAQTGGSRRAQLGYAARQVLAAPRLRAGLRVPRRRGAVP